MSEARKPAANSKRVAVTVADEEQPAPADEAVKPLIVSRPILKAPQSAPLLDDAAATTAGSGLSNGTASLKAGGKPAFKPLTPPAAPAESPATDSKVIEKTAVSDNTDKPPAAASEAESESPVAPTPSEPAAPATPGDADKSEADDDQENATPTEQELNAEAEAQAKHDEVIQKLVDSKQYFLPINAVEKRKTQHFIILGVVLSLFLLLAWGDIALDAGLIQVSGVKPVTHFFSN